MTQFAQTLKTWRAARRYSQLDLAGEAEISARHLSFLETGRARPSRDMVLRLGAALDLPLDAQNQMLGDAGFAAQYDRRDWTEDEMAPIRLAISQMLDQHMPFPALVLDRFWTIRQANAPALALYGLFGMGEGDSLLDLLMSPALPQVVENWSDVAYHTAQRLRTEAMAMGGVPAFEPVVAHLLQAAAPSPAARQPVIPTVLHLGAHRLSLFATIAQFGTPEDVGLEDMKVELFFPMDTATRRYFADG